MTGSRNQGWPFRLVAMRAAWRMSRVALHLAWAVALVACAYPLLGRAARLRMKQHWSRHLLAMLGLRLHVAGSAPREGELVVANHVSWLDIHVINAVWPCTFVSKDDVRAWPLVGWLSQRIDTIFLARRSARAAHAACADIAAVLADGMTVAVFPEGTTSDGCSVLPFHGALLQGALDVSAPVRPLALRYVDASGRATDAAAYCGETRLIESLWRIACAPALCADVAVLSNLHGSREDRRLMATVAHGMIIVAVEHGSAPCGRPDARRSPCNYPPSRRS